MICNYMILSLKKNFIISIINLIAHVLFITNSETPSRVPLKQVASSVARSFKKNKLNFSYIFTFFYKSCSNVPGGSK